PRTAARHIPKGLLSGRFVLLFSLVNAVLFLAVARVINPLCLSLSPIALLLLFGYSYMQRVTSLSHLFLGLVLGTSPVAAWIAVRGAFAVAPLILGGAVASWVAGFDVIYAIQDFDFDRSAGLHSLVVRLGIRKALWAARVLHAAAVAFFFVFGRIMNFGWVYEMFVGAIALLFLYEHSLVSDRDLSRVNAAFFNVNGFILLLFLAGVALSI